MKGGISDENCEHFLRKLNPLFTHHSRVYEISGMKTGVPSFNQMRKFHFMVLISFELIKMFCEREVASIATQNCQLHMFS